MEYQVHTCNLNVKTNFIEITHRSEAMSYIYRQQNQYKWKYFYISI